MRYLLILVLLAPRAFAQGIEREDYKIIGWNDACGVAVERYAYPRLGDGFYGEPIMTRVGTISIVLATSVVQTNWALEFNGAGSWDQYSVARIRRKLKKAGFDRPGFPERIRDAVTVDSPGSREVILSTAALDARPTAWPGPEWRWGRAEYNPLGTCALMIYEKAGERYKFMLTRIYNPSARSDRGRAHTTNGRLLFNAGDLDAALAETEIGARLAPELAATRYHYAAMLALTGHLSESMRELRASVARDPRFIDKAAADEDFDSLRNRQDFREIILKETTPPPAGHP